jgi:hypothetical protein
MSEKIILNDSQERCIITKYTPEKGVNILEDSSHSLSYTFESRGNVHVMRLTVTSQSQSHVSRCHPSALAPFVVAVVGTTSRQRYRQGDSTQHDAKKLKLSPSPSGIFSLSTSTSSSSSSSTSRWSLPPAIYLRASKKDRSAHISIAAPLS